VVATAASRPLTYTIRAVGTLEAYQVVTIPAKVAGTVQDLALEEGQRVTPTLVLARVDPERFRLEEQQAEAAVAKADATAARAKAQAGVATASLTEAKATLARRESLQKENAVAREELEAAKAEVARWTSTLAEATATAAEAEAIGAEARAKVALAKKSSTDAEVRSPLEGIVDRKHVALGQYVKVGDPIATIVDTSCVRVRFPLTSAESLRVREGALLTFRSPSAPGKTYTASITKVSDTADPRTRMVDCLAQVEGVCPDLKPGFFADVEVQAGGSADAVVVPETAVTATEAGFVAYVIDGSVARRRVVTLGLRTSAGELEILSGLEKGATVAVRGVAALQEGSTVDVQGRQEPPSAGTPPSPAAPVTPALGGEPR
jgi:membrane fusion protein (multidrug efflux system)/multidrug efflux system membrane fusion protein